MFFYFVKILVFHIYFPKMNGVTTSHLGQIGWAETDSGEHPLVGRARLLPQQEEIAVVRVSPQDLQGATPREEVPHGDAVVTVNLGDVVGVEDGYIAVHPARGIHIRKET